MTDNTELKRLLDACRAESCNSPRDFKNACEALFDACSIETIAGLVAENERLSIVCSRAEEIITAESKAAGIATGRANLLENERDQVMASFKNFHRSLCERFGYYHDDIDWQRDQASLEEHIAAQFGHVSAENSSLRSQMEAVQRGAGQLQEENEALNSAIDHLERSRVTSFEEYDFSRLKGRAGAQKVFEITIETECGCDIEEGEYTVRVTHLLGNWLGEDDFSLIEEAVAEVIADLNLPEEGHTTFIAFESGERQDVFWTKWFEIVNVASVLAEPDAAMGKGEQS
ncbi:hypothetical protein C4K14_3709 [Pseudomonas chlororaphis subsp. aureofaciens]|uniref:hypothetical protein n=1 Tax=Pseudomonas chlororaphis TaxID=587753 RepID=UPI000F58EC8D|nr:hypothetical protein [Pseudomonas chlororaphis]AZD86533.1 hypothetical protein C4K14_3709 [Pseudomonas chlororaphis subsp. aureofaciens]